MIQLILKIHTNTYSAENQANYQHHFKHKVIRLYGINIKGIHQRPIWLPIRKNNRKGNY